MTAKYPDLLQEAMKVAGPRVDAVPILYGLLRIAEELRLQREVLTQEIKKTEEILEDEDN